MLSKNQRIKESKKKTTLLLIRVNSKEGEGLLSPRQALSFYKERPESIPGKRIPTVRCISHCEGICRYLWVARNSIPPCYRVKLLGDTSLPHIAQELKLPTRPSRFRRSHHINPCAPPPFEPKRSNFGTSNGDVGGESTRDLEKWVQKRRRAPPTVNPTLSHRLAGRLFQRINSTCD